MATSRTTLEIPALRPRGLRLCDLAYRDPTHGASWSHRRVPEHNRLRIDTAESTLVRPHICSAPTTEKAVVRFHSSRAIGQSHSDLPTGLWTFFDRAGNKDCEGRYEQGRRTGLWLFWYSNGTIDSMGEYADDLEEGPWISFHTSGVIEEEGRYRAGEKVGIWTYTSRFGSRSVRDHGRQ